MPTNTYLHSDIQEIMVTKPSFTLRWGTMLIVGLLLVLLLFVTWFQYPEFVATDVSIAAGLSGSETYLAQGTISREQYAEVQPGQRVLLQVHELGNASLTGQVQTISPLAEHYQHRVIIRLATTRHLRLYPSFSGSARILLRQRSLLAKFFASK